MLRLVGSNYYFRRAVPLDLRPLLGRGEVSHSLKTSNKLEARQKAALFYARTGQCFQEMRRMTSGVPAKTLNAMDLVSFYEQFVKDLQNYHADHIEALTMRHKVETTEMLFREVDSIQSTKRFLDVVGRYLKETEDFLQGLHQQDALNQPVSRTRETMLREEITGLRKMVVEIKGTLPQERLPTPTVSPPKKQRIASSQTISAMTQRFILNDASKSADTLKGTRTTVDLFVEAFGDLPVTQITGTTAGDFKDLLLGLPATHGKAKKCLPIRDAVKVAKEQGLKTLSGKTAKNHFSRLSALWSILVQREIVSKNPWMKWSFNTTKETDRRCWTDEELVLLAGAQWEHRGIARRTYAGMVNVALYTGLRLGEICNLRCQDIENVQGVACFQIRPHPEEDWSPKSAAGTRLVPIHSQLIKAGILEFLKSGQHFLFPDLATSTSGVRGAAFGQAFSKLKTKLGFPDEVTFHSFRHTVSTKLRNQDASLRELWIDRVLGHEASHRSQGTMNYTSSIDVRNLQSVIEALKFPSFTMDIPDT